MTKKVYLLICEYEHAVVAVYSSFESAWKDGLDLLEEDGLDSMESDSYRVEEADFYE